MLGGRLVG